MVDGEEHARLRADASALLHVQPGHHIIQARIDWVSSPKVEIHVSEGETVALECTGQRNPFVAAVHLAIRRHQYLELKIVGRNAG
jgi:hypothetical protein